MTGYAPDAPVDTPTQCGGEPWRLVDGAVQCLSDFTAARDLASTGGTVEVVGIVIGLLTVLVGLVVFIADTRRRASGGVR